VGAASGVSYLALAHAGAVDVDDLLGLVLVVQNELRVFDGEGDKVGVLLALRALVFQTNIEAGVGGLDSGVLDVGAGVYGD